jgi:hypothetical protein
VEPFTLIIWLMMGQRFEETRILNLGHEECFERADTIRTSRCRAYQQREVGAVDAKVECHRPPSYRDRIIRELTPCTSCGLLLGRRRI